MTLIEDSSYLHSAEFLEDSNALIIEFKRGNPKKWKYSPVTREGFNAMMMAESTGSYFSKHIRDNPDVIAESIN